MGKTIGILSLKGGVGKTSVVVALGKAISGFDKRVLLVDGNLSAPNLGMHLNLINPETTLHHALNREKNITDTIHHLNDFDIIPGLMFGNKNINPFDIKKKLKILKRKYDVILIDSSPSLSEEASAAMLASDEVFIVTTPDYPTLSMTLKSIKIAKDRGTSINGLILNKAYGKNFELSLDEIEKTSGVPVMAVIPYDVNVLKALSEFQPSTYYKPKSKGSREFKKLAAVLVGEKENSSGFRRMFKIPKRQDINREIFYDRVFK